MKEMLVMFSPIFVADIKLIFGENFVNPLTCPFSEWTFDYTRWTLAVLLLHNLHVKLSQCQSN